MRYLEAAGLGCSPRGLRLAGELAAARKQLDEERQRFAKATERMLVQADATQLKSEAERLQRDEAQARADADTERARKKESERISEQMLEDAASRLVK